MIRVVLHTERAFAAVYNWKENKIRRNYLDILYNCFNSMVKTYPYGESYPLGLIQEDNCIHRNRPLSILLKSISYRKSHDIFNFKYFVSYSITEYAAKYGQLIRLYDDCYPDRLEWGKHTSVCVSFFISVRVSWSVHRHVVTAQCFVTFLIWYDMILRSYRWLYDKYPACMKKIEILILFQIPSHAKVEFHELNVFIAVSQF